jgi:PAS domain S-box-containing protein
VERANPFGIKTMDSLDSVIHHKPEELEWLLDAMFEQVVIGMAYVTPGGRLLRVNQRLSNMLGHPREELLNRTLLAMTHPEDEAIAHECYQRMLNGEFQTYALEIRYLRRDGSFIWVHQTTALLREPGGPPHYFIILFEDVTERRKLEEERVQLLAREQEARAAAQANEMALRRANQSMDEFFAIASHEMNSPITAIKGYIQLAEFRLHSGSLVGGLETLQQADYQCNRLSRLVGDLLDVSRARQGKMMMRFSPCDLIAIVQRTVEEQQVSAPERSIHLSLPALKAVPIVADADRIGQVLTNYLSNALRYSPQEAPVVVSLRVEAGKACVAVRDEGPGIPLEQQELIWERFHQVDLLNFSSGLGLGLYISKMIICQHQGSVSLESAPGLGSTFYFTLPLADASDVE